MTRFFVTPEELQVDFMVLTGDNAAAANSIATKETHPDISFINNLNDWKDFVTRTPEEYERWMYNTGREAAEFEIAELIAISQNKKVIVDTNIPIDIFKVYPIMSM